MHVGRISSFGSTCSAHRLGPIYASVIIWYTYSWLNAHTCHVYPTPDKRGRKSWNQMTELQTLRKFTNSTESRKQTATEKRYQRERQISCEHSSHLKNSGAVVFSLFRLMMQQLTFLKLQLLPLLVLCVLCACVPVHTCWRYFPIRYKFGGFVL